MENTQDSETEEKFPPPFFFFLETNIKPTAKVKKREKKSCFEDSNFSVFFSLQEKIVN